MAAINQIQQDDDFYTEFEDFLQNPSKSLKKIDLKEEEEIEQPDLQQMDVVVPPPLPENIPMPSGPIAPPVPDHQQQQQDPNNNQLQHNIINLLRQPPPLPPRTPQPATMPNHVKIFIAGRNPNRPADALDIMPIGILNVKIPLTFYRSAMAITTLLTMSLRYLRFKPPYSWAYEAKALEARDPHMAYSTKIGNMVQNKECYPHAVQQDEHHLIPCVYAPDDTTPQPHARVYLTFAMDFGCLRDHKYSNKSQKSRNRRESTSSSSSSSSSTSSSSTSSSSTSSEDSAITTTSKETHKHESSASTSSSSSASNKRPRSRESQNCQNKKLSTSDLRIQLEEQRRKPTTKYAKISQPVVKRRDPYHSILTTSRKIQRRQQLSEHRRRMFLLRQQRKQGN